MPTYSYTVVSQVPMPIQRAGVYVDGVMLTVELPDGAQIEVGVVQAKYSDQAFVQMRIREAIDTYNAVAALTD